MPFPLLGFFHFLSKWYCLDRYPPECEHTECEHFLMWNDTGNNFVQFSLAAKVNLSEAGPNPWTAIGFSNDTKMVNLK